MPIKKWLNRAYKLNEAIQCVSEANIPQEEKQILINRLDKIKKEILFLVKKIEKPENLLLLIERYLNFKRWNEIAEKIGYSEKWTKTELHYKALKEAEEVIRNGKNKNKPADREEL